MKLLDRKIIVPALTFCVCVALSLAAAWERPFHSDEAVQAWRVWAWLGGSADLVYEPRFHGLTLYYFAAPFLHFGGNEVALRLLPILICAGTVVALPAIVWGFCRPFFNALVSLVLASVPLWIFYSGDFIQEPIFVSFAWLAGTLLFSRERIFAGAIFAGLAIASKESWPFFVAAFFAGGMRFSWKNFAVAASVATFVALAFYSSFFTWMSHFDFSVPASVENDVNYFFVAGTLLPMIVFALAGMLRKSRSWELVFFTVASVFLWAVYFILPHREPWLLLSAVPGTVLAFAESARILLAGTKKYLLLAGTVFLNAGTLLVFPLEKICGYVETSRGNAAFVEQIEKTTGTLAVYGNAIWPLPWQLRERENVGYFDDKILREEFEIVVAPVEFWESWNAENYWTRAVGELRDGVILEMRTREGAR